MAHDASRLDARSGGIDAAPSKSESSSAESSPIVRTRTEAKKLTSDGWTIRWTPDRAWGEDPHGSTFVIYHDDLASVDCDHEFSGQVLSVVGAIVSVYEQFYADCGGAHPSATQHFRTVDLTKLRRGDLDPSANLFDFFDESEVTQAMKVDPYLMRFRDADLPCEYSLLGYETEWAIYDREGDRVGVRLGLPHGCEVMRGRLTEIGLTLTPKPNFEKSVITAANSGHLMRQLAPNVKGSPNPSDP